MRTTLRTIVALGSVVAFSSPLAPRASAGQAQPVQGKVAAQPAPPAQQPKPANQANANPAVANSNSGGSDFGIATPFVATPVVSFGDFIPTNPYSPGQFFPLTNAPWVAPAYPGYTHQWDGVGNGAWNGQETALGLANNVGGTPMGAYGMASISGGGSPTIPGPLGSESLAGKVGIPSIAGGGAGSVQGKTGVPSIAGSPSLGAPSIAARGMAQQQGSRSVPAQSTSAKH
jgi:hypothetical protein